ncbi:hypothetical protein [Nocardioides sp. GXZ039]|uniref:hypothetical protein n=1 Tax=Nocardioides sp. GXZ039 TaxID=3136018 RepID=UPI0030F46329
MTHHRDPYAALAAVPEDGPPPDHAHAQAEVGKRPNRAENPVRLRAHTLGRSIVVPGPRTVARVLVLPLLRNRFEVWQESGALALRPQGDATAPARALATGDLMPRFRRLLETLPPVHDEGRPYADLRTLATLEQRSAEDYVRAVAVQVRVLAPRQATVRKPSARRPAPKAAAERVATYRARVRLQEEQTAAWAARIWGADLAPGNRIPAAVAVAAVQETAASWIAEYADHTPAEMAAEREDDPTLPERLRLPREVRTYAALDAFLGRRRKVRGAFFYVVPGTRSEGAA